ncbi:toxin-antitoxin system YwqK family antitoxin [Cetobacterium sp. SF1]|uniref:toxin-antitoxin system YwqK family antitoxin n=1 Tax=Cetobacterium sp. SF1 TaxID=3417654 RepID=UPI003CE998DD
MKFFKILLFIIFLSPLEVYGNSIHPNLKLKLYEDDSFDVNGILKFERNKNKYNIIFQKNGENINSLLDKKSLNTKIKSVFLYDINGDNIREIFIIFNENGKNSLEGYSLRELPILEYEDDIPFEFYKTLNIATSEKLNIKIKDVKNFNSSSAKKELKNLYPYYKVVNLNNYDIWNVLEKVGEENYYGKSFYHEYELLPEDYEKFNIQKYFKIYSLENLKFIEKISTNRILFTDGKYYFIFFINSPGLITLEEVFQGKLENNKIIKNGKYFNSMENGFYENNIKVDSWNGYEYFEELKRYLPIKKYYSQGKIIKKEIYYRRLGELNLFSKTFYNSENKIEKIEYYEENGEVAQIKIYEDIVLKNVINYSHYKRNYAFYDNNKQRKGLSKFKDLNLINMKLENEKLNLYSLDTTEGNKIFIELTNYSPKYAFLTDIRWYDDIFKYFGVKRIFYGKIKNEKIHSLEDIIKDGYYEEFSLGSFPGKISITNSTMNIETLIESGNFKGDKKVGIWEKFDRDSGDLLSKLNYEDGNLEGDYELYHGNGVIKEKGTYKNGEKEIIWKAPPMILFSY